MVESMRKLMEGWNRLNRDDPMQHGINEGKS